MEQHQSQPRSLLDYHPLYTPLDPQERQIRLLTILPGSYLSGITCTWTIVSLNDRPDFEVLSYTQENRTIAQPIILDHQVVLVRQTLWNALRRLRRQELPRTIWAYAFCVNRKDDAEKSHQTALMDPIYWSCRKAILWLGEADSCALATMAAPPISCEIKGAFELLSMFDPDAHIDELPCYERDRNGDVREKPGYREHFNGLRTLSECALWTRTWRIQDTSLLTRASIMHSQEQLSLDDFYEAICDVNGHFKYCSKCYDGRRMDSAATLEYLQSRIEPMMNLHRTQLDMFYKNHGIHTLPSSA